MPYAGPVQFQQDDSTAYLSTTTLANPGSNSNAFSSPNKPARAVRRVPAPAILPPVVASTSSTLHLALKEPSTASGHSLSRQVDELLARHLSRPTPSQRGPLIPRVKSPAPPPIPPKQERQQQHQERTQAVHNKMARGPLPNPPSQQQPEPRQIPHQYPASYGPSISKIRSFSAQPPVSGRADGLPPSLIPGGGRQQDYYGQQYQQPWQQQVQKDTVSRSFARGGNSILLHKGFFDLLSVQGAAPRSSQSPNEGWYGDRPVKPVGTLRAVTAPVFPSQQRLPSAAVPAGMTHARLQTRGNKRISVDMVGKPMGFTHLAHASDAEQAEEILTRWRVDGNGKLAEPAWVVAIKEAARTRARAQGVAQVQAYQDAEHAKGSLKIVNGNPDSLISNLSNRADSGSHDEQLAMPVGLPPMASPGLPSPLSAPSLKSPAFVHGDYLASAPSSPMPPSTPTMDDRIVVHEEIPRRPIQPQPNMWGQPQQQSPALLPPPTVRANTAQTIIVRNGDMLDALKEGREGLAVAEELPASPPRNRPAQQQTSPSTSPQQYKQDVDGDLRLVDGKPFKPSLETVERSVATKIYLENHYYGILKRPRDRDQRRAALERELAAANMTDSQRRAIRAAWTASETEHLRDLRNRVHPNSFLKVKTIGHGAFGVVSLVREKGSGELYAMKQLRKADMLRKGQEGHVRAERDVMSAASSSSNSRWIVRLVYSFQDVDHLYLVMEYIGGGDLLNLLIEKDIFEEGFAKFYIAEMVLAVQEAHKLGYIHRDIKPDNFIFSSDGHIKLSDFGLATDFHWAHDGAYYEQQRRQLLRKHGIDLEESSPLAGGKRFHSSMGLDLGDLPMINGVRQGGEGDDDSNNTGVLTWRDKNRKKLAYSVVGTNSYMSPEVIRGTGYDQSCDWWSMGIILFECLYGYPPFVSKSRHITRQKILTWRQSLRFPSKPRVSREAQDLISRLICEREDRLGSRTAPSTIRANSIVLQQRRSGFLGPAPGFPSLKDGAEDIKAHPWFRGVDFKTLHLQEPPFRPELKDPSDTRYFDDDINDEPLAAPDAQPGQAEATKDPMLRDKVHGKHLLDVRKQLAFQGYTFKSPKQRVFDPRNGLRDIAASMQAAEEDQRGRSMLREPSSGFRRAMSL